MNRRTLVPGAAVWLGGLGSAWGADVPAWRQLPPTPALPRPDWEAMLAVAGAELYVARFGQGAPVLLLHGGLANAAYWGHQIPALAERRAVIALDTRGHGRSPFPGGAMTYDLLADDVLAVMDRLGLRQAAIVGWSDGAIIGLKLALRQADRVAGLFAFGANANPEGLIAGGTGRPTFAAYAARVAAEYRSLSPHPERFAALEQAMDLMWQNEPRIGARALGTLRLPVTIADGDHDEVIRRRHTEWLAVAIPGARLLIERGVSHFAMLQDPAQFNADLVSFLDGG